MKKWTRVLLYVLAAAFAAGIAMAAYIWNKPHRDVSGEQGISITATALFDSFSMQENRANILYLNKAIQVTGTISAIQKNQAGQTVIVLKSNDPVFGVNCTFRQAPAALHPGSVITFKGICTGYLSDVILNEGVLVKK